MLHKIGRGLILFMLGAMTYGFIDEALEAYGSRAAGNIGGEVLILPLMAGLIWLGWELRGNHK